jgi:hypothetical protein
MLKPLSALLMATILFNSGLNLLAQKAKVANTSVEDVDNKLVITYDILNAKASQSFNVSLEITGSSGDVISAYSLSGDIGENVTGGSNKQIIWDYNSDRIVVNEMIYFEIIALPIQSGISEVKDVNTGKAILLSTILPGLGLTNIKSGGPYWLMGIAGYGCLGASYFYNKKANESYTTYLENTDASQNDELLSDSQSQNLLSKTFAYSAIGIWSINIVWTAIAANRLKQKKIGLINNRNLLLYAGFDPFTKASSFTFKLNF